MKSLLTVTVLLAGMWLCAQPTVSDLTAPPEIEEGAFETYRSVMTDPLGQGLSCTWDFGDGTVKTLLDRPSTGHVYKDDGSFTLTVTVEDDEGSTASASLSVTVKNVEPEIRLLKGREDEAGNRRVILESVVHDPGDDDLRYFWSFGDGNEREGRHLARTTHTYESKGAYTVRLTVEDGDGGSATKTVQVKVEEAWEGTFSGHVSASMSGGSGVIYNNYVYEGTNTLSSCFKQLALFDDDARSIIVFALSDMNPLSDYEHSVVKGGPHEKMGALLFYNIPDAMYDNTKMRYLPMEILDDVLHEPTLSNMMPYAQMRMPTGPVDYTGHVLYRSTSGSFKTEPIEGSTLKGTFSVTLEANDPEDSDNPPFVVHASGSFDVELNKVVRTNMENGCEDQPENFSLINYTPNHNQENVHPEYPCFELEFSSPLDMASIDEQNIQVGYYDADYLIKTTPLDFEEISESHIRVIPAAPLRPGVKYICFVIGGREGVKDIDGGELDKDYEWEFSTLVEPSDARVRVYQTIQDALLVAGKEAMVRVQVFWDKPEDIAPESFVRKFPADVIVKNAGGERVCPDKRGTTIKHYDEFDAEDVRFARNSVNVFGWKPSSSDGENIEIEVKPLHQECVPEDEQIKYKITHAVEHWDLSPRIHIQYYFLKIADWEDGVPAEEIAIGDEIMRKATAFGEQIFPVRKMSSQNMGEAYVDPSLYLETDDPNSVTGMTIFLWNKERFQKALRDFYFETGIYSQADVVIVFHPYVHGQGGMGGALTSFGDDNEQPIPFNKRFLHMTLTDRAIPRPVIEHEIGHTFYLEHDPPAETNAQRTFVASQPIDYWEDKNSHHHIQGFRIYQGQNRGANKDCKEGNAEHSTLANVMFPDQSRIYRHHVWINEKQYERVMDNIEITGTYFSINDMTDKYDHYWVSLDNPEFIEERQTLYASGSINTAEGTASISEVREAPALSGKTQSGGTYTLRALNASGNTLGSCSFEPLSPKFGCLDTLVEDELMFLVAIDIPKASAVRSLEVVVGGKAWGTYTISQNPPEISFVSPSRGDSLSGMAEISWSGRDADNDQLTYTLMYSHNGLNDWVPVGKTRESSLNVNSMLLPPGESPAFRIQASDGAHVASAVLPVHLHFPLHLVGQRGTDTLNPYDPVVVQFSNPIDPSTLHETSFELRETTTAELVDGLITYDEDSREARFQPYQPLTPGSTYTARLSSDERPAISDSENNEPKKKAGADPFTQFYTQILDLAEAENTKAAKSGAATPAKPGHIRDIYGGVMPRVECNVYCVQEPLIGEVEN